MFPQGIQNLADSVAVIFGSSASSIVIWIGWAPLLAASGASLRTREALPMAAAGKVAAWTTTSDFIDIGVPEDYRRAQEQFARA